MTTSAPDLRGPSRRTFIRAAATTTASALFIPRTWLFGQGTPPSRQLTIAQIGCGRMGLEDMRGTIKHDLCRFLAVCDLDANRLAAARAEVEQFYRARGETRVDVGAYRDYHEVLARPDIDAVIISPPDHWHGLIAIEAALAGKDLYVQKPVTYDIAEASALRNVVRARRRILQVGSQQRSARPWDTFRGASEAVRNGRIGRVHTVRLGIGQDQPKGIAPAPQPVPPTFDFHTWLGPAPEQPYMEDRVHPQQGYGRPGWITTEDFGLGMITNWGSHHVDIAHWALGLELGGPALIDAHADFMTGDVWTVHHTYHIELQYPNGCRFILDHGFPNGIRFEGTDGWVFCARGAAQVTASDPGVPKAPPQPALAASHPDILRAPYGDRDVRWPASDDHYLDWLRAVAGRRDPIAPIDQGARSLQACALGWIGMKLGRKLAWDPQRELFPDDPEANALCARPPRSAAFDLQRVLAAAGLAT